MIISSDFYDSEYRLPNDATITISNSAHLRLPSTTHPESGFDILAPKESINIKTGTLAPESIIEMEPEKYEQMQDDWLAERISPERNPVKLLILLLFVLFLVSLLWQFVY